MRTIAIINQKGDCGKTTISINLAAARVFEQECIAYPAAIQLFAENRLQITNNRVRVLPMPVP